MTIWVPVVKGPPDNWVEWTASVGRSDVSVWWYDDKFFASRISHYGNGSSRHQTVLKDASTMTGAKLLAERWANGKG